MIDLIYIQSNGWTDSRDIAILVFLKYLIKISLYLKRFFERFFRFLSHLVQINQGYNLIQLLCNLVHRVKRYRNFGVCKVLNKD